MIDTILKIGEKTGFSTIEVYREKIEKQEFDNFIDHRIANHEVQTDRVSVRAFWEAGDPAGFHLSKPNSKSIKDAFANIYAINFPEKKKNYSHLLPASARKVKIDIFDGSIDSMDSETFRDLLDRVNESVVQFSGLRVRRIHFSKVLKKVYLSNSHGLNIKYRKSNFKLDLSFAFGDKKVDISENKIFFNRIDPFKIVSRAFNLLNAVSDNKAVSGGNSFFIFAPEASAFILREFSRYLRVDGKRKKVDFSFPAILNVVDDPLLDQQVDSAPFDDEGVQGGERFLIRKGSIINIISNIRTAFENKTVSSGNGFRNDRSIFPAVRFSNLYIKPTILPLNNLMQDASQGILVGLLKLKRIEDEQYLFSAYGYRFENNEFCESVHFYFKTSFLTYF
ncbi:metallopeptidase TldD-related protein, partial [Acidobacteriota bacterium]